MLWIEILHDVVGTSRYLEHQAFEQDGLVILTGATKLDDDSILALMVQTQRYLSMFPNVGNPEEDLKDYAIIDSGCSGSMTGDKDKLSDFKEFKGGYVAFGNGK
ncbi:hypothetical protein Tco_0378417 [Tanacetum coccineum]